MAIDPIKFAALEAAFDAIEAPDKETLMDAMDFLNAYADIGVWDADTETFTFVDVRRARLLAKTLRLSGEPQPAKLREE